MNPPIFSEATFIGSVAKDQPLYRIMPLKRFEEMFRNRALVLVNPSKWEDPFESFLLKCKIEHQDKPSISIEALSRLWGGQCWTTNSDTDAMWRIYSHDKSGVRIKTTIRKLANAMETVPSRIAFQNLFIGKVEYRSLGEIKSFLNNSNLQEIFTNEIEKGIAKTLLIKRKEFEHEAELRILANTADFDPHSIHQGLFRIPMDPHILIDEVCIDPRMSDPIDIDCIEKKIRRTGFTGTLIQSELYQSPDFTIRFSPSP